MTRSYDPASTGTSHMSIGLLQLSLPQSTVEPLQRVQNAAARMIFNLRRHENITPCLSYSVALATSPLQNNLQAVHSDVQHPSREVSMLPS